MGRAITAAAHADSRFRVVAGLGPRGREYIGKDIGQAACLGIDIGAPVSDDLEAVLAGCDAVIDFSTRELSLRVLASAARHRKALVCGTTGFSDPERDAFRQAAVHIPLILAANTSKVVNVMNSLLELAAKVLGKEADIEIIEMHDRCKLDAPSGTAKEMGHLLAQVMGGDVKDLAEYGRVGTGARKAGTIGFHSLRIGGVKSSHSVIFGCMGERLEIAHHAYGWDCFAEGACEAAYFLKDRPAGFYTIKDVLGLI
jgi:4-hydroxy-tetrahydrodipicolinate reductase